MNCVHCYDFVLQWDLVCDRRYLSSLATTIYFSGVMVGGVIFGTLSDLWGRKPFMLFTLYTHIFVGVGIAFADSYIVFVLLRFVQGALMQVGLAFMYLLGTDHYLWGGGYKVGNSRVRNFLRPPPFETG